MDLSPVTWRKTARSQATTDNCVEVAYLSGGIAMRDSKDPDGPRLTLGHEEWRTFTARIKGGSYDLS